MFRPLATRPFGRIAVISLGVALWLGVGAVAAAAPPEAAAPAAGRAATAEEWKGRFCTAGSCRNRPASPIAAAASFGAAIFAVRWLARRPAPGQQRPDFE
jgi:hypothetical protein